MIFNVSRHIQMIRNGLSFLPADTLNSPAELRIIKTQTRRLNRGIYKVGKDYAVQHKRGVKAEPNIRIVMDRIWEEDCKGSFLGVCISIEDAQAEGGYHPLKYEETFKHLTPKWHRGEKRWAFEFHVIEIRTKEEKELYRKFDEAQIELDKEVPK